MSLNLLGRLIIQCFTLCPCDKLTMQNDDGFKVSEYNSPV